MAYGLRKINEDGVHHNFQWSLEVGAIVECPDWNPNPECGNGLHLLQNAQGDWGLLYGHYWSVIEYDEKDLVMIDSDKGKVPRCKIIEIQDPKNLDSDKLLSYFDISKFDSRSAYCWAVFFGNRDIMINRITDSQWAFMWALHIGDRSIMIDRVTESKWAYWWGRDIGDRDIMIDRITESKWAYQWTRNIGNHDVMIDRVTESEWAYLWARYIGDHDVMIDRVTKSHWAAKWNESFPANQIKVN